MELQKMTLNKRLLEISSIILDVRDKNYGNPFDLFNLIAKKWSATLGIPITPQQVGLLMIDLKLARYQQNPKNFDSLIDIIGYVCCLDDIENNIRNSPITEK